MKKGAAGEKGRNTTAATATVEVEVEVAKKSERKKNGN